MTDRVPCYVDGAWMEAPRALGGWVCNASTGEPVVQQGAADDALIERALAAADASDWGARPAAERAEVLEAIAARLDAVVGELARVEAMTTGVVIRLTELLGSIAPRAFRAAAAQLGERATARELAGPFGAVEVQRIARGPAAVIAPWNAPSAIAAHKIASALAAGCPVVVKPSEHAPHACEVIARAAEAAGLPGSALQVVHGGAEVGARLVADARVRAVSFTGGLAGGRAVAESCAARLVPAQLELGGNNPMVVLAGADVDRAADGAVEALTTMNGQWCRALGRLLVHRSLAGAVVEAIDARLAGLRIGDALDRDSDMGPLANEAHRARVAGAVQSMARAGVRLRRPARVRDDRGWFFAPTLIEGARPEDTVHEVFGPVAAVHVFDSDEEAVALANGTPYGLAAYVFGPEGRARELAGRVRAGSVKINGVGLTGLHAMAPRPALGLSGLGDEGVVETLEFFRASRVVGVAGRESIAPHPDPPPFGGRGKRLPPPEGGRVGVGGDADRVLIAGAGPVGLSLALALARRGVPVDVFEAEPSLSQEARASTLHPRTLEMFAEWGVIDDVLARGARVDRLQYWERRTRELVAEFPYALIAGDTPYPFRLQCPQHELTPILHRALLATGRGRVHFGRRVTGFTDHGDRVELHTDSAAPVTGSYLVGADGARSAVRAHLGLQLHGTTYEDRFLLVGTDLALEPWFPGIGPVSYVFDPDEWVIVMRLPDLVRIVFRLPDTEDAGTALTDAAIRARVHGILGETAPFAIRMRSIYSVHQRVAERFRVGRVVLAGDAAHVNNPTGGMGMNSGIHDAHLLAAALGDDAAMDAYAETRRRVAVAGVQASADANYRRLTARDAVTRARRDTSLRAAAADPALARAHLLRASMLEARA